MNTAQDMTWIIEECRRVWGSFEYFCDGYVWIEDKENKCAIKLELWPEQRKVLPDLVGADLLELLKTRQVGLTWLCAAMVIWLGIRSPLFLQIIISASEDHAIEFLDRVYFILDRMPEWLVPPIKTRTKQVLEFFFPEAQTVSTIKSMPTIQMGAESKTPNVMIIDEAHMIRIVRTIFNSSYPGIEQAKGRLIVIANSIKNAPGWPWVRETYQKSMRGENRFKRIFLPWYAHPERPKDFRQRMEESGMDPADVIENYPETEEEAISSALSGYFGGVLGRHTYTQPGVTGEIVKTTPETVKEIETDFREKKGGPLTLWRYPYNQLEGYDNLPWLRRYCIGSDVSEGLGQSYSVAYVMDRLHDEFVCRLRSNRIDAYTWANLLHLLSLYYDRALVCVEVTGAGQTTVKRLAELKTPQYVRVEAGVNNPTPSHSYGWAETHQSKYELAGDLREWLRATQGAVYCSVLLDECSTFIRNETGKLGPEEGKYSDTVIAAGLTLQASQFLGEKPKQVDAPVTGWRAQIREERKASAWAA